MTRMGLQRLTRKRVIALQNSLAPYGVSFTRGWDRNYNGLFSLYRLPIACVSPVCPMIRCGMELIEQAERESVSIATMLHQLVLSDETVELVAYA